MKLNILRLSHSRQSILAIAAALIAIPLLAVPGFAATGSSANTSMDLVSGRARLMTNIDSKNARQGERITAKLTGAVRTENSMTLPSGTMLIGQVEQVQMSTNNGPSKLALVFNQARLNNGRTIPIKATLLGAYPSDDADSFNYTGTGGPYMSVQPNQIASDHQVDQQPGTLSHVAMHSAVQSPVSAVFSSNDRNVDLHRGTELQVALRASNG
jgi:hypothetical protein